MDGHQQLEHVLNRLLQQDGVDGVQVIRRDGQCLVERFRKELDVPTYSFFSAILAATSETLLPEFRATHAQHLMADSRKKRVILVKANEDLLLGALTDTEHDSENLIRVLHRAALEVPKTARFGA